jgi:hypothetical protein
MGHYRYRQAFLNVAVYLYLIVFLLNCRPCFLFLGFGKLISFVACACLLLFVVQHSREVNALATSYLQSLPAGLFFSRALNCGFVGLATTAVAVPKAPSLSPAFQRPPPIFSL